MSRKAINDTIQTVEKEVHFFFFPVCCTVFNCSWQLITLDKKQKGCIKRVHLVTDNGLYDQKSFYEVKSFLFLLYKRWRIYHNKFMTSIN